MEIRVIQADYNDPYHRELIPQLLDAYARDPMGGGVPLAGDVKQGLVNELSRLPYAFTVIAFAGDEAVGLANCFESFSTFACKPIINIHDIVVIGAYRQKGISQRILAKVEEIAKEKSCCKLTLEVLSNNESAKGAYQKFGFTSYQLDPDAGVALFWQKHLS